MPRRNSQDSPYRRRNHSDQRSSCSHRTQCSPRNHAWWQAEDQRDSISSQLSRVRRGHRAWTQWWWNRSTRRCSRNQCNLPEDNYTFALRKNFQCVEQRLRFDRWGSQRTLRRFHSRDEQRYQVQKSHSNNQRQGQTWGRARFNIYRILERENSLIRRQESQRANLRWMRDQDLLYRRNSIQEEFRSSRKWNYVSLVGRIIS